MELISSPYVITSAKSPTRIKADILRGMAKAATDAPLPAFCGDEFVGCLWRDPEDGVAYGLPYSCGFQNYNDLLNAIKRGRKRTAWLRYTTLGAINTSWYDTWPGIGGTYSGTALTARQFDATTPGALPLGTDVPAGASNHWIGLRCTTNLTTNISNVFMLYDRVLTYESVAISSTLQTFTNTLPALRYIDVGDYGLRAFYTLQTNNGATASSWTSLNYKNMAGSTKTVPFSSSVTPIRVSQTTASTSMTFLTPAGSGVANFGPFFSLAAGDMGVKTLEDCTMTANNTGTICLGLAHPFLMWSPPARGVFYLDQIRGIFSMEKIRNGACIAIFAFQGNNSASEPLQTASFDTAWS